MAPCVGREAGPVPWGGPVLLLSVAPGRCPGAGFGFGWCAWMACRAPRGRGVLEVAWMRGS